MCGADIEPSTIAINHKV